jgi:hypothetical protein
MVDTKRKSPKFPWGFFVVFGGRYLCPSCKSTKENRTFTYQTRFELTNYTQKTCRII